MYFVLVKFKDQSEPRLLGTTHVDDCYALATMRGVEWASHSITGSGHVLPRKEYIGRSLIGEEKVIPILPEDGHQHMRALRERIARGVRPAEEDAINKAYCPGYSSPDSTESTESNETPLKLEETIRRHGYQGGE